MVEEVEEEGIIIARDDIEVRFISTSHPIPQPISYITIPNTSLHPDEDDYDRRPQRRRYEDPPSVKLRKQLLSLAESPLRRVEDEIVSIASSLRASAAEDPELREAFQGLVSQLVVEQPFKIPFVAAVVLALNALPEEKENEQEKEQDGDGEMKRDGGAVGRDIAEEVLRRAASGVNEAVKAGMWREVKLYLKFLGSLQGMLTGEGVFPVLEDVLGKAVDLQTENNEEVSFFFISLFIFIVMLKMYLLTF